MNIMLKFRVCRSVLLGSVLFEAFLHLGIHIDTTPVQAIFQHRAAATPMPTAVAACYIYGQRSRPLQNSMNIGV